MATEAKLETATEIMQGAGFTLAQEIAIQRIVNRLTEDNLRTLQQLNKLMDRLKPEAWL